MDVTVCGKFRADDLKEHIGRVSIRFPTCLPRSCVLWNAANQQWKSLFDAPEIGECGGSKQLPGLQGCGEL